MQLYIVTWKFESSEDQNYSSEAFVDYVESGNQMTLLMVMRELHGLIPLKMEQG